MDKIKYLKNKLEHEKIKDLSVYYKGRIEVHIEHIEYYGNMDNIFLFTILECETKYTITEKEIQDILVIPFDNSIIILVLNNDINIEIHFNKEKIK